MPGSAWFPEEKPKLYHRAAHRLLLPILFILGKDYFNNTVNTREEIEKVTRLPFLGHKKKC